MTVFTRLLWLPLLGAALLSAQTADGDVAQTYAQQCAGCHGADARGSQQGPGLAGNLRLRRRNAQSLRNVITRGIPAAGMPGFKLPAATLDGLVAMIVSLNASAAEAKLPGDVKTGATFFFGEGRCSTCHMVAGRGAAIGPDLSAVARELTVDQLREAVENPSARIAPGYGLVRVERRGAAMVRGFARNRTGYEIAVQDLKGGLQTMVVGEGTVVTEEKASAMPAAKMSADLLAYLASLAGVKPGALTEATGAQAPGAISFARIQSPKPGDWLTYNGNLSGNRYSPLTQINGSNVGKLALQWTFSIPLWAQFLPDTPYFHENMRYFGLETVPLVADGIMYLTGPNQVHAVSAMTGQPIWQYARPRTPGLVSDPSLGTNRGVAILGDNVFFVTDNAHLLALNRVTGRIVWEQVLWDEPQKYGGTIAPLIVKDLVVVGVAGGDWGIRGFVSAYKEIGRAHV